MGIGKDLGGLSRPLEIVTERGANLLSRLFAKPASEIGELLGQEVEFFRLRRKKTVERAADMIEASGAEANRVPLNILVPLLQAAPLEENEQLQEHWAALLANAALHPDSVPPSYIRVLSELTPKEAQLFHALAQIDNIEQTLFRNAGLSEQEILNAWDRLGFSQSGSQPLTWGDDPDLFAMRDVDLARLNHALKNLARLGLLDEYLYTPPTTPYEPRYFSLPKRVKPTWGVSHFGRDFLCACTPPTREP